jgi:hypothetical protein
MLIGMSDVYFNMSSVLNDKKGEIEREAVDRISRALDEHRMQSVDWRLYFRLVTGNRIDRKIGRKEMNRILKRMREMIHLLKAECERMEQLKAGQKLRDAFFKAGLESSINIRKRSISVLNHVRNRYEEIHDNIVAAEEFLTGYMKTTRRKKMISVGEMAYDALEMYREGNWAVGHSENAERMEYVGIEGYWIALLLLTGIDMHMMDELYGRFNRRIRRDACRKFSL